MGKGFIYGMVLATILNFGFESKAISMLPPGDVALTQLLAYDPLADREGIGARTNTSGQRVAAGSITMLTPTIGISSAHQWYNTDGTFVTDPRVIVGDRDLTDGTPPEVRIAEFHVHPGFVFGSSPASSIDILLFELESPIAGITQVSFGSPQVGMEIALFGFGDQGVYPNHGAATFTAKMGGARNLIDCATGLCGFADIPGYFEFSTDSGFLPAIYGDGISRSGDSGGGVFNRDTGEFLGVMVAGGNVSTLAWSVDSDRPWIQSYIPEPGTIILLAGGLLGLGFIGRRRS
ncbi:MAG: PEP-CTERM sorting domain-containing protein [Acidobacteria bacterium]|nr:PEP-CTERM sorting domain-containing protein [Acidobacteriota bacterium]